MKAVLLNISIVFTLLCVICITPAGIVTAATGRTTGDIRGQIKDETGQPLPGATVTLVQIETNETKTVFTDDDGSYYVRFLSLGPYEITAELYGLGKTVRKGITLTIGSVLTVDIVLRTVAIEETITVVAEAPIIETVKTEAAVTIDAKMMEHMPSNQRSWLNHIRSVPGATAIDDDYRVQVGGQRSITNSIMMDGADTNSNFFGEQRGGTRPAFTFSQEAVKEFQVINAGYSAEFGRAAGAIVNAVTKSGTNDVQGSLFYLFRDETLVSKDAYDRELDDFSQQQFGFNVGGPLKKNKAFFFVNFDSQDLNRPVYVNMKRDEFLGDYFNERYTQTEDEYSLLMKADIFLSSNHRLSLRHNFLNFNSENGTTTSSTSAQESNGLEKNQSNSFVASLTSTLTPQSFNELRLQYSVEKRPRYANTTDHPEITISGIGGFGQNNYLPNGLDEYLFQLIDNFNYTTQDHDLKIGTDLEFYDMEDWFLRYAGGQYIFDSYGDYVDGTYSTYTQAFDMSGNNGRVEYYTGDYAFYLQDTWRVRDNLTINAGVRYDFQDHPEPDSYDSIVPEEWQGILPEHSRSSDIPEDGDNFGPRLGIAWDPMNNNKTVIKFGAGVYYPRTPSLLVANALLNNGYRVVRLSVGPYNDSAPTVDPGYYGTDWKRAFPTWDSLPYGSEAVTPDIYVFSPDFENPQTLQYSLSVDQEVLKDYAVGVQYIYAHTTKLERLHDINLKPPETVDENGREKWNYRDRYYDSRFNKIIQFESTAESIYNGLTFKFEKRWTRGRKINYQVMGSYTYASSYDDDSNERSVGTTYGFADNQYHYEREWGPSDFDVKHRAVFNGTVEFPYGISAGAFMVYQTGKPWTATTGSDSNSDGYRSDRPYVDGEPLGRNSFRHPDYKTVDLHLSWAPTSFFFQKHNFEFMCDVFNVVNWDNLKVGYSNQVYDPTAPDKDFGKPNVAGTPRTVQLGLRYRFK
ncbi:TonB-dependent receptor [bacterium]|nr:TonB-dependent receptor [candidate division CSSED10-310 bacterium]